MKNVILYIALFLVFESKGQFLTANSYQTLEVGVGNTAMLLGDTIFIDTLILRDNAVMKFVNPVNYLIVNNAFIGQECYLDASGDDGQHGQDGKMENLKEGKDGQAGKSLTAVMRFATLGSLYITSDGGDGGDGGHATKRYRSGRSYGKFGWNGGNGGDGGDGGSLEFYYYSPAFVPMFNGPSNHSIYLTSNAGRGGKFGMKDPRRRSGSTNGGLGGNGKQGSIVLKKLESWNLEN